MTLSWYQKVTALMQSQSLLLRIESIFCTKLFLDDLHVLLLGFLQESSQNNHLQL